jgi:DNA-directed RNA polymerase subunit H (RpoH/RPB5)
MIPALGAGGPGFESRNGPFCNDHLWLPPKLVTVRETKTKTILEELNVAQNELPVSAHVYCECG